jgi:hypothetical protein
MTTPINKPGAPTSPENIPPSRRSFLKILAGVAGVATATGGAVWKLISSHSEHMENPEVIARLQSNASALRDLENTSVQAHFNAQQARDAILVPKSKNEEKICCIDERYSQEGKGEGIAGVGVLLSNEALQAKASELIDQAEAALSNGEQQYTFNLCPHGAGKCGAAKLARTQAGEQDMSKEAIDRTALQGAQRLEQALKAEIRRRPHLDAAKIVFDVHMLPEEHFLQSEHHPGAVGLHHAHSELEMNLDRNSGLLMYNLTSVADGILSAKIALGDHGFAAGHGSEQIQLPQGIPYRIIITAPDNKAEDLVAEYQRELAKPENEALRNKVRVEVWKMNA